MSSSSVCTNSRLAGLSSTHSTLGARLPTGSLGSLRGGRGLTRSESERRNLRVQAGLACNWLWGLGTERRSEEHTSELKSLMRISNAVFCLKHTPNNNKPINLNLINIQYTSLS